jgi:integrase
LRASEVVGLKVGDIDSQRMTLRVEQGKGRKDRYAMLSPVLLERLRVWWRVARAQGKKLDGGWLYLAKIRDLLSELPPGIKLGADVVATATVPQPFFADTAVRRRSSLKYSSAADLSGHHPLSERAHELPSLSHHRHRDSRRNCGRVRRFLPCRFLLSIL